jgi:hypothetical protein
LHKGNPHFFDDSIEIHWCIKSKKPTNGSDRRLILNTALSFLDWERQSLSDAEPWPTADSASSIQPQSWDDGDAGRWDLFKSSIRQHYNLFDDVEWDSLRPEDFTPEQRLGIAYWFALDSVFEQTGATVFAKAMIESYELRVDDATRRNLVSVTRDEANHDLTGKLVCQRLIPGFPHAFTPKTELERAALRNIAWAQQSVARFWRGYCAAYKKHRFQVLLSGFASGEAVGTMTYARMAAGSRHPVFKQLMKYMAVDESRHLQLALSLAREYMPSMTEAEGVTTVRNMGASYAYFSLFMAERPNPIFWGHLPNSWVEWHRRLEEQACAGGLFVPDGNEKNEFWRRALLRVKSITDPLGIQFIAVPELGIEGREEALSLDDAIAVGF